MTHLDHWETSGAFATRGAAEIVCGRLMAEDVPAQIEVDGLEGAIQVFRVVVPRALAHRARWILAQEPPSEAELDFLATGKLPDRD